MSSAAFGAAGPDAGPEVPHAVGQAYVMPLVDVTYDAHINEEQLRAVADALYDVVPLAVECPEEPLRGPPALGDLEIRFHPKGPIDIGGLSLTVQIRTKRFDSRMHDAQQRAERVRERLSALSIGSVGVWLILLDGAWAQD